MFIDIPLINEFRRIKKLNKTLKKYNLTIERHQNGYLLRCRTCKRVLEFTNDYKNIDIWRECGECNLFI